MDLRILVLYSMGFLLVGVDSSDYGCENRPTKPTTSTPSNPSTPDKLNTPKNPNTPDNPYTPKNPNTPATPNNPANPVTPTTPTCACPTQRNCKPYGLPCRRNSQCCSGKCRLVNKKRFCLEL